MSWPPQSAEKDLCILTLLKAVIHDSDLMVCGLGGRGGQDLLGAL